MGDSDTVGAIAGGLFGAYYGFSDTPHKMYEKLEFKEDIMKVSDSIKKKYF
jgi:ADP-ribosylglycohydrolase